MPESNIAGSLRRARLELLLLSVRLRTFVRGPDSLLARQQCRIVQLLKLLPLEQIAQMPVYVGVVCCRLGSLRLDESRLGTRRSKLWTRRGWRLRVWI